MSKGLTGKQELFCLEYIKDFNATQAAINAGYSKKTASAMGSENLTKPEIQQRIAELQGERSQALKIDAQYVLRRLIEIDQMDVKDILNDDGTVKAISEWPQVWRTTLSSIDITEMASNDDTQTILRKIKWPDKAKNLELLGKHVDINAFSDKFKAEIEIDPTPVKIVVNVQDARKHGEGLEDEE